MFRLHVTTISYGQTERMQTDVIEFSYKGSADDIALKFERSSDNDVTYKVVKLYQS